MKSKILLVDDHPVIRAIVKDILDDEGYDIVGEADNGSEGYDLYCQLRPDIVLLDINMPVLNGLEAINLIKAFDSDARIVVCSAMGDIETITMAIKNGARDYIKKPFSKGQLLSVIRKIV
jgi:two-component system chemotaxis response regulator CheY